MKKALSAVLAVVLVLGVCFSVPMIASATNADKFTYELNDAQNPTGYIITGVKDGVTGEVEIPATYKPTGDINIFYPNNSEEPNVGSYEVTTTVSPSAEAGTAVVTDNEGEAVVTIDPADGYTLKSITVGETPVAQLPTAVEGVYTYTFTPEADVTVAVVFEEETPAPATYTVTIDDGDVDGCSVVADKNTVTEGEDVVLTITTADGYELTAFTVNGEDKLDAISGGKYTVEDVAANVAVVATFTAKAAPKFAITDCIVDGKGSATATVDEAAEDDTVTVEVEAEEGYALKTLKYTYNDGEAKSADITKSDAGYTFTMPAYAVTIEATFVAVYGVEITESDNGEVTADVEEAEEGATVTLTVEPATGYKLKTLTVKNGEENVTVTNNTFTMPAAAVTVTAEFEAIEYTITLPENVINGTIAIEDAKTTYHYGDAIELTLTPAAGCQLGILTYTYVGLETPVAIENGSFSMPAKNITINVTFVPKEMDVIGIAAGAFQNAKAANITAFTVAEGQDLFVAKDGVLFEKVTTTAGDPAVTTTTLKLIAFPANYTVAENAAKTYTIPASVTVEGPEEGAADDVTYAVTAVADGAFQALGNVQYVFCANAQITTKDKHPAFADNNKLHLGMTAHAKNAGTTVAATCKVAGATTFKCTVCSIDMPEETIVLPIDENAHAYGDWVTTTPATCILEGVAKRTCTNTDGTNVCGHVETKLLPATGEHTKGEATITTNATCTTDGLKTYYCTGCGVEEIETEVIPATGHKISDPDEVVKATCTEDGYVKGICDNCETEQTIPETKKGHKMITVVDAKATCTVAGSQHEECEVCGYMDPDAIIETIPATGHSKADKTAWTVVKEATCAEAGLLQKFCDTCHTPLKDAEDNDITRVLEATGRHEYKDYTETKAPTCTEKGEKTGTCACGKTDVQEIAANGHKFAEEFTTDREATCTEAGSKSKHCTVEGCNEKSEVTAIPVKAHTADETWTVVEGKEATCYAEGEKTGTCAVCETENCVLPVAKIAHTWAATAVPVVGTITKENVPVLDSEGNPVIDEVTGEPKVETITYKAATCEADGYTVKYCTVENCGAYDEATLTKVDKLGHSWAATEDIPEDVVVPAKVEPTCTEIGHEYKYCSRCNEVIDNELVAIGHSWKTTLEEVTAPTCTEKGSKAYYCANTGCTVYNEESLTETPALGHLFDDTKWETKSAATCLAEEVQENTCLRSGCANPAQERTVGEKADHDFSETITRTYPTCEEDGIEYYACTVTGCDARDQEKVLPALGHIHADDAEFEGTEATCTTDGVKVKACTRIFLADGSLYVPPVVEDEPTEGEGETPTPETPVPTAEGDETTTPEDDETEVTLPEGAVACAGAKQITKATGHAFSAEYTVDTQPTCTVDGVKSRHCTNTGCTVKTNELPVKALGHEYGETYTVDTKATCSATGVESIHCVRYADCKNIKSGSARSIPTTDHTYQDTAWKTIKAPTCEEKGIQENYCTVCCDENSTPESIGYATRETNARGHIWGTDYVTVAATCTTDGKTYLPCERSGCTGESDVTVLPKTGHNWATENDTNIPERVPVEGEPAAKAVTCTEDGYEYKYCKTCKVWIGAEVKAEGHKFKAEPTRVDPTCYAEGSLTGECSVCNAESAVVVLPKLEHTWGAWELVEDATDCTVADSMIRVCTVENCTATELGKNDEHTASGWIISANATCGTAGEMHTVCKVCDSVVETEEIKATGKHNLKETIIVAPTCNEKGEKTVTCQTEGCAYTDTVEIPANGHTYTEWKVFVEPTCTTKGIRQSVCEVCLTTQSEKILALGHDLGGYVIDTPAACGVVGSKHKECSRCDYKTDAESIAALEHNFVGNNCTNNCGAKIYEYSLIEGSTTDIIITKYNGDEANLVIPAEIDGYVVKAIGNRAFMKTIVVPGTPATDSTEATEDTIQYVDSTIASLTIPATITTIGDYAFANSALEIVNIPATVTTIGKCAFGFDVVITMVEGENAGLVEEITPTPVANFTIYGVEGSAAETYAAQKADDETDNFTFVAVADVYEVVIGEDETNIVEVADGIIFKEFVTESEDENTPAPSIEDQIKAVVVLPENSTYEVEVEASLAGGTGENAYAFYGTGSKIIIKDDADNVVDEILIIIEGDVNGDSVVDAIDCMLIQLATKDATVLEGVYYTAGNIAPDTAIDANDFSAAVDKIFGADLVVEEEETTVPTTEAPASTEPSTEGTSEESSESTPAESEPTETTTQTSETTTTTEATETTTQTPAPSEPASDTPAA